MNIIDWEILIVGDLMSARDFSKTWFDFIKDAFGWDHMLTSDLRQFVHPIIHLIVVFCACNDGMHTAERKWPVVACQN